MGATTYNQHLQESAAPCTSTSFCSRLNNIIIFAYNSALLYTGEFLFIVRTVVSQQLPHERRFSVMDKPI